MTKTVILPANDPASTRQALEILAQGGLVAFPTDTVYGVGALVSQPQAITQLYAVKGRSSEKAIPILLSDIAQLRLVALEVSETVRRLADRFWPGPLTLVVPRQPSLPGEISSRPTIGVRMPDHPIALALIRQTGPLAVTSANLSGGETSVTALQVMAQLGGRIPLILDGGQTPGGSPSTVVDCSAIEPRILRPGPISLQQILEALS